LAGLAALSFVLISVVGLTAAEASDDIVVEGASSPPPVTTPPDPNAPKRLLDVEAGVGAIIGIGNDPPVEDDVLWSASLAVRLIDRLDGELSFLLGDTKERGDENDSHQLVKYLYGGLRYYPYFAINGPARPYLFFGPTEYWDLEDGESETGLMSGIGIRFQPGESFGFTLKLPVVVAVTGGETDTMMLPTFNLYWQFNLGGGAES
jgi:hypothetical protein